MPRLTEKQIKRLKASKEDFVRIPLTKGQVAIIDKKNIDKVAPYSWCASKHGNTYYVKTCLRRGNKYITMYLHRLLLTLEKNEKCDHRDGNGLNNRENNIRGCTNQQNGFNSRKQKNCLSRFKGVCFDKSRNKYIAQIMKNGILKFLGRFKKETDAGLAYNKTAIKEEYFGKYAKLNEI